MGKTETVKNIIQNNYGFCRRRAFQLWCGQPMQKWLYWTYPAWVLSTCWTGRYKGRADTRLSSSWKYSIYIESALFYYGYSDFTPRQWSIAVPRTFSRTKLKIDSPAIKAYFVQPNLFEIGRTTGEFNGVQLSVYDRERTICDCFKYRTKIDSEMFCKALNAYAVDNKKNLSNLSEYAKKMRVYNKMVDMMEVLLNGWFDSLLTIKATNTLKRFSL